MEPGETVALERLQKLGSLTLQVSRLVEKITDECVKLEGRVADLEEKMSFLKPEWISGSDTETDS